MLRVIRFVGTRLGFGPDAKTIHKYRSALAESGVMDELFAVLTQQLVAHGYELQEGAVIDGSLGECHKLRVWEDFPYFPEGKKNLVLTS